MSGVQRATGIGVRYIQSRGALRLQRRDVIRAGGAMVFKKDFHASPPRQGWPLLLASLKVRLSIFVTFFANILRRCHVTVYGRSRRPANSGSNSSDAAPFGIGEKTYRHKVASEIRSISPKIRRDGI